MDNRKEVGANVQESLRVGKFDSLERLPTWPTSSSSSNKCPIPTPESSYLATESTLSAVKKVMSPYDEFAVETALQHRDSSGWR
jgi:hypothetical protein